MESTSASPGIRRRAGILSGFFVSLPTVLLCSATEAFAVQAHGGAEGLVSHQLGHLLFTLAMVVLLQQMRKHQLSGTGWREFKGFLLLIVLWNILTFSGHWMREKVAIDHFVLQHKHVVSFQVETLFDLIFYITRLDHLVLVPAFVLLLLAVRNWGQTQ